MKTTDYEKAISIINLTATKNWEVAQHEIKVARTEKRLKAERREIDRKYRRKIEAVLDEEVERPLITEIFTRKILAFIAITLSVYLAIFKLLAIARGYVAYGGEIFILLAPIVCVLLRFKVVMEEREKRKEKKSRRY